MDDVEGQPAENRARNLRAYDGDAPRDRDPTPRTPEDDPKDGPRNGEDGQAKKPGSRKRWLTIVIVATLAVLGLAAGIAYYLYSSRYVTTDDAFVDADIVRVVPQEAGVLVQVAVGNNAHVEAGDLLARIDPRGPMAELALRQAQLVQAEAQIAQAKAQIVQAQTQVSQASSTLNASLVEADNARTQADRLQDLFKRSGTSAISQQRLDDTRAQARQATARADAARTGVDNATSGVTAAKAALQAAEAQVEAAKATVATAQVSVDHLTVAAPIDGQVVQKNVNIGSYVQPGTQMMAIVPKDLYVTANYKETQLSDIRIGQAVDLSVDAFPDIDFKGTVRSIQNGAGQAFQLLPAQNATGNYVKVVQRVPVRISIDSPSPKDHPIGPGMSVVPSIHVD